MTDLVLAGPAHSAAPPAGRAAAFPSVADLLADVAAESRDAAAVHAAAGSDAGARVRSNDDASTALLILGRDEHDRPHASRFEGCDAKQLIAFINEHSVADRLFRCAARASAVHCAAGSAAQGSLHHDHT